MIIPAHEVDCWRCHGAGRLSRNEEHCACCGGTGKLKVPEQVSVLTLTKEEYQHAMEWLQEHAKLCSWANGKRYAGAIGGTISWSGANTSIGQIVNIECVCGEERCCSENI